MTEKEDAVEALKASNALAGIAWAWSSTRRQSLQSLDTDTGHNQGWVGYNAHTVLIDRLDRVFALNRFAVESGADLEIGADLVALGLMPGEYDRMPRIKPGIVIRDDLNNSPGWRIPGWRVLLQSYGTQDIDDIRWATKRPTKKRVAKQATRDEPQLDLGLPMAMDVLADLSRLEESSQQIVTLVNAYSIDADTGESECYIGHPRFNAGGGQAWHWKYQVTDDLFGGPAFSLSSSPSDNSPTNAIADAPVKLRPASERKNVQETE